LGSCPAERLGLLQKQPSSREQPKRVQPNRVNVRCPEGRSSSCTLQVVGCQSLNTGTSERLQPVRSWCRVLWPWSRLHGGWLDQDSLRPLACSDRTSSADCQLPNTHMGIWQCVSMDPRPPIEKSIFTTDCVSQLSLLTPFFDMCQRR
jgi:hypothetical protein